MNKKTTAGIILLALYVFTTVITLVKINGMSKKIYYSSFTKGHAEKACDKLCIALADDMFSDTKGKFTVNVDPKQESVEVSRDTIAYKKGDNTIVFTKLMLIYLNTHRNYVYRTIGSRLIANIEVERGKQYGWINNPNIRHNLQYSNN